MEYIQSTLLNLVQQTAFLNLTFGNMIMIFVAFIFLYLAIKKGFEPAACPDFLWYAAREYLSGYHAEH